MASTNGRLPFLVGALAITLIGLWVIRRNHQSDPVAEFVANFDTNLQGMPIAAAAARDDPSLRNQLLQRTKEFFVRGGWDAANGELRYVLASEIEPYADDAHIIARERAGLALLVALEREPLLCKNFVLIGGKPEITSIAKKELSELSAAHWENVRDGTVRKHAGITWLKPGNDEIVAAFLRVEGGPTPLSTEEADAFERARTFDHSAAMVNAAAICKAYIVVSRNILALPESEGARLARIMSANVMNIDFLTLEAALEKNKTNLLLHQNP